MFYHVLLILPVVVLLFIHFVYQLFLLVIPFFLIFLSSIFLLLWDNETDSRILGACPISLGI